MTCWSLSSLPDDLTSAWKYQFPVPCRVEKMPKLCCSHQTLTKTCMFVRKTMGLRRWGYDSKRMTRGSQSALKDKDVSWPHPHGLDSGCWLASMRQAQMPQFQEAISSVRTRAIEQIAVRFGQPKMKNKFRGPKVISITIWMSWPMS